MTVTPTLFDPIEELPVLPYGGTSGWSGSSSSEDRARTADSSGVTGERQARTMDLLREAGMTGLTWHELSTRTGWHHGTASGALSVLHKVGAIARLAETRGRSAVYVMPDKVGQRQTTARRTTASSRLLREILHEIDDDLEHGRIWEARRRIRATLDAFGDDT